MNLLEAVENKIKEKYPNIKFLYYGVTLRDLTDDIKRIRELETQGYIHNVNVIRSEKTNAIIKLSYDTDVQFIEDTAEYLTIYHKEEFADEEIEYSISLEETNNDNVIYVTVTKLEHGCREEIVDELSYKYYSI